jgi:hypothetical protein
MPTFPRRIREPEAAWLGALIDGEGSVIYKKRDGSPRSLRLQICNTDPELLSSCLRVTQLGTVYSVPHNQPNWRPAFHWVLQDKVAVENLLRRISKYSAKAQRALEAIPAARLRRYYYVKGKCPVCKQTRPVRPGREELRCRACTAARQNAPVKLELLRYLEKRGNTSAKELRSVSKTASVHLNKLAERGLVTNIQRGIWSITQQGKRRICA